MGVTTALHWPKDCIGPQDKVRNSQVSARNRTNRNKRRDQQATLCCFPTRGWVDFSINSSQSSSKAPARLITQHISIRCRLEAATVLVGGWTVASAVSGPPLPSWPVTLIRQPASWPFWATLYGPRCMRITDDDNNRHALESSWTGVGSFCGGGVFEHPQMPPTDKCSPDYACLLSCVELHRCTVYIIINRTDRHATSFRFSHFALLSRPNILLRCDYAAQLALRYCLLGAFQRHWTDYKIALH